MKCITRRSSCLRRISKSFPENDKSFYGNLHELWLFYSIYKFQTQSELEVLTWKLRETYLASRWLQLLKTITARHYHQKCSEVFNKHEFIESKSNHIDITRFAEINWKLVFHVSEEISIWLHSSSSRCQNFLLHFMFQLCSSHHPNANTCWALRLNAPGFRWRKELLRIVQHCSALLERVFINFLSACY